MIAYVRVREDARSALSIGLVPGASYPLSGSGRGSASLRVVAFSGEVVQVPLAFVEPAAAALN